MRELTARIGIMNRESSLTNAESMLMARLERGEAEAMEELVRLHGEPLDRLVGRLTAWHADKEDILQEVFLTVWKRAGSFRGDGSLAGWLRRIAINTCRNQQRGEQVLLRKLKQLARIRGRHAVEPLPQEQDEKAEEVQSALAKLKPADRTVLVLFYLEELEGPRIAELLNISQETLHVRLHRARKRMEQYLSL